MVWMAVWEYSNLAYVIRNRTATDVELRFIKFMLTLERLDLDEKTNL